MKIVANCVVEIYIEALLVNKDLADQVWEAWDKGVTAAALS